MQLSPQAFKKMYNLRFLKFHDSGISSYFYGTYNSKVHFSNGLSDLSGKLRSLIWHGFPLRALPSNFIPKSLVELNLRDCNLERLWEGTMPAPNLKLLILGGCKRLTNIPDLSDAPLLEVIDLSLCRSLLDFPKLAQHLKNLYSLDLCGCVSLRSLPKLFNLNPSQCTKLNLENCSKLEIFPEIWETMQGLQILELSGTAIKELPDSIENLNGLNNLYLRRCKNLEELPSSICNLTSLQYLDLSDCSNLEILPDNLGNLKSLNELSIDRTAISQLPSTMMHLNELDLLSCSGCRGLRFTHSSDFPCSLRYLDLSDCNLKEIPEDICHLSLLEDLELSGNDFESLPKSMMQLSNLEDLKVNNCNMLQSLTELPLSLDLLSASDCKQLRSILLDASELVKTEFVFTNCPNLEEIAVGNILATVEGYEGELYPFSIFYPGSEVPGWFRYKSNESSIKFRMACHDLLQGSILCAVIEFEEYRFNANDGDELYVDCSWTFSDGDESNLLADEFSDGDESDLLAGLGSCTLIAAWSFGTLIDSDHVALWYCKVLDRRVLKSEFTNFSVEFWLSEDSPNCRVKSCGVRPITKIPNEDYEVKYAEPIKISGVTIEDIGETSGKRSRTSNDRREEEGFNVGEDEEEEDGDDDVKKMKMASPSPLCRGKREGLEKEKGIGGKEEIECVGEDEEEEDSDDDVKKMKMASPPPLCRGKREGLEKEKGIGGKEEIEWCDFGGFGV
ncbi:hypothetical protein LWI29_031105 [Acer saccharum]|uniref:Disease resistance R13L4/SHOC-2-like LRR domain-containing protein n=1 Tax=Acer saccharum TaxID=4024 RepID=A0AA39T7M3_ACESA|nr:hypothetical protein LWI29_031105 [Acer saccharum]